MAPATCTPLHLSKLAALPCGKGGQLDVTVDAALVAESHLALTLPWAIDPHHHLGVAELGISRPRGLADDACAEDCSCRPQPSVSCLDA